MDLTKLRSYTLISNKLVWLSRIHFLDYCFLSMSCFTPVLTERSALHTESQGLGFPSHTMFQIKTPVSVLNCKPILLKRKTSESTDDSCILS